MILAFSSAVKCPTSSIVIVVTLRSGDGSSKNRRTVSDMPSRGVNVTHTGP